MKIAVFFPGRVNAYEHCIHEWRQVDKSNFTFFAFLNEGCLTDYTKEFLDFFKMDEDQYSYESVEAPTWIFSLNTSNKFVYPNLTYYQLYTVKKSYQLITEYQKKHNVKFDVVLKYRPDILSIDGKICCIIPPDPDTLYIPMNEDHEGGINDQIAYGTYETMGKYCSILDNLRTLVQRNCFHPESLVREMINYYNLKITRFFYPYTLHPGRLQKYVNIDVILLVKDESEFRNSGHDDPKPLVRVMGKTILDRFIDCIPKDWRVHILYGFTLNKHKFKDRLDRKNVFLYPTDFSLSSDAEIIRSFLVRPQCPIPGKFLVLDYDVFYKNDTLMSLCGNKGLDDDKTFEGEVVFLIKDDLNIHCVGHGFRTAKTFITHSTLVISEGGKTVADVMGKMMSHWYNFKKIIISKEETVFLKTPRQVGEFLTRSGR